MFLSTCDGVILQDKKCDPCGSVDVWRESFSNPSLINYVPSCKSFSRSAEPIMVMLNKTGFLKMKDTRGSKRFGVSFFIVQACSHVLKGWTKETIGCINLFTFCVPWGIFSSLKNPPCVWYWKKSKKHSKTFIKGEDFFEPNWRGGDPNSSIIP